MANLATVPIFTWAHLDSAVKAAGNVSLGQGGYGTVYKGCLMGLNVAIKVLSADSMQGQNEFSKEVAVLGGLQHPHLLSLIGCCPEKQALVYPLMEGGSLADRLVSGSSKGPLLWQDRVRITHEVALSLVWLHERGVVHMDLKPANVLLDRFGTAKVCDVGLAVQQAGSAHTTMQHSTKIKGTIGYLAPEYFKNGKIGPAADVYALGVIMCEMLTSKDHACTEDIEEAFEDGASNTEAYSNLSPFLDPTASWPQHQALQFAGIATSCLKIQQKKRPNLQTQLLPQLQELASGAALTVATTDVAGAAPLGSGATTDSSFMEVITCPICVETLKEPVVTPSGHTFCKVCIEGWLAGHNTCPTTRQPLQVNQLVPNYQLRALLEKINKGKSPPKAQQQQTICSTNTAPEQSGVSQANGFPAVSSQPNGNLISAAQTTQQLERARQNIVQGTQVPGAPDDSQRVDVASQHQQAICLSIPPRGEALKRLLLASKAQLQPLDDHSYFGTWKEDSELANWKGLEWRTESGEQKLTAIIVKYGRCGGYLPVSWGSLVSLQHLAVCEVILHEDSQLPMVATSGCTCQLPSEWSALKRLTSLQIRQSYGLSGGLPTSWSALTALKELTLDSNSLTRRLPPEWSSLSSLTKLYLHNNRHDGPLPPEWAALSNLRVMSLGCNKLTGRLPLKWSTLTSLTELYLQDNKLDGPLPPEWAALRSLRALYLSENELTGRLPTEWSSLTSLTIINLYGNKLDGPLPPEWAALHNLQALHLSRNKLTGRLPPEWSSLTSLTELYLYGNKLDGPLPPDWAALRNLQVLYLSENELTGRLPTEWSSLTSLTKLYLYGNKLDGPLPPDWAALRNLQVLYLSENELTGRLPTEWSSLTSLRTISLLGNKLDGPLPPEWAALRNLRALILSRNKLTGRLPSEWSSLTSLRNLYLECNQLEGPLPPEWAALRNLDGLRLFPNNITHPGRLPPEWRPFKS